MLDKHNLELKVWLSEGVQVRKQPINTLTYRHLPQLAAKKEKEVVPIPHEKWAYEVVRKAADKKISDGGCTFNNPLPIIFCQFVHPGHGITPPATKIEGKLTRACLIHQRVNDDKVTLIHEMGHAVEAIGDSHSPDRGNYMHEAEPRSFMYRFQVERMARAMYAVG